MADKLRWGIIATGGIARQFAEGLAVSKTGTLVASGSRSLEKATAFAEKHGGAAFGSYEEVLAHPDVDAVYIAGPHHLHAEWTIKTAQAGKGILCEKPFTLNIKETEEALAAVKAKNVFFMEAFMYRCSPQIRKLVELLDAKAIGEVLMVNSEFGFQAGKAWDNFRADGAVGGGGLMDVGSYCVSLSRLVFGEAPEKAFYGYQASPTGNGYDETGAGLMVFAGGKTAHFGTGVHVSLRNDAMIYGDQGRIHISDPWKANGSKLTLFKNGAEPEVFELGVTNAELYGIEADAVAEFFEAKECPYVSIEDTRQQMKTLDMLRASAGFKFGNE